MPLITPTVPSDVLDAMKSGISAFVSDGPHRESRRVAGKFALPKSDDLGPPPYPAHEVFNLSLADAASTTGVSAATRAGWRFIAGDKQDKMLLGRISNANSAGVRKMTAAFYGPRVWAAYLAIGELRGVDGIAKAEYEPRVLHVPSLNIQAFWLSPVWSSRDPGDANDLVVPFPLTPPQAAGALPKGASYTGPEFAAMIRRKALFLMAVSNGASGS